MNERIHDIAKQPKPKGANKQNKKPKSPFPMSSYVDSKKSSWLSNEQQYSKYAYHSPVFVIKTLYCIYQKIYETYSDLCF